MKRESSDHRQRPATRLGRNLEHNLVAYLGVAGAALLVAPQAAHAEVVYTPSNIPMAQGVGGGALTQLDLKNDGTPDFVFSNYSYQTHGLGALLLKLIPAQPGNEVWGIKLAGERRVTAAALSSGVQVGSKGNFANYPQGLSMALLDQSLTAFASGSWLGVETAYLGLKFVVNGETHYGWARIKFVAPGDFLAGSIYGYAYETVPNRPIVTGQISGTLASHSSSESSTSLGLLAAGASGLSSHRQLQTQRQ